MSEPTIIWVLSGLGAIQIAGLGFIWTLHRDVARLGERVASLEGYLRGLNGWPRRISATDEMPADIREEENDSSR